MDSNAEYTPDGVVTELVPSDLTPDAIILGEQPEADILWSASVIIDNGPLDDPEFISTTGSCTVSRTEFGYSEQQLEEGTMDWLADQLEVDLEDLTVVSFRWSTVTY